MLKYNYLIFLSFLMIFIRCADKIKKETHQFTNDLVHETSPYLLQHAHNPVYWKAWNKSSLEQARKENEERNRKGA